jgi:hypothetical protein
MDRAAYEKKIDISKIPAGSDTAAIEQMCR